MNKNRLSIFLVCALLALLSVLAFLQYRWLGQVSAGEREQMQRRLDADTKNFAEDFNREIQSAYFNFQLEGEVWLAKDWKQFNERFDFWREKTAYKDLIKNFYFINLEDNRSVLRYNKDAQTFENGEIAGNLSKLLPGLKPDGFLQPVEPALSALLMPIHKSGDRLEKILIGTKPNESGEMRKSSLGMPKKLGVLIVELDEKVIKEQLLPDLSRKYFSEGENANFKLVVVNGDGQAVFQTQTVNADAADSSAKLFDLSSNNFVFYSNREMLPNVKGDERQSVVFSRVESIATANVTTKKETMRIEQGEKTELPAKVRQILPRERQGNMEIRVQSQNPPNVRIFESKMSGNEAIWTLNVQHRAGSLDDFNRQTRNRNLAVSFGILTLLAVSIILIFVSSQRARLFAQRQVDFVSSVSHEFRTPLAVIYSAGENLADGVAKEQAQVAKYGDLIKGEGRKLSSMVEQILDFAGANSGKKKYDLRKLDVTALIAETLAACEPLLAEKGFRVETDIAAGLPSVKADKAALGGALQNLIANSVKYSNGSKWLKISARNGGNFVKIIVEDKGIGIADGDLKHIFEPFYRAKAVVDEQIHGNGLGLSLVKQTIAAHGGRIAVESEFGKGSRFIVQLPLHI